MESKNAINTSIRLLFTMLKHKIVKLFGDETLEILAEKAYQCFLVTTVNFPPSLLSRSRVDAPPITFW